MYCHYQVNDVRVDAFHTYFAFPQIQVPEIMWLLLMQMSRLYVTTKCNTIDEIILGWSEMVIFVCNLFISTQ